MSFSSWINDLRGLSVSSSKYTEHAGSFFFRCKIARPSIDGLSPYDRKMLDKAQVYEMRLSRLKLDARRIFPIEIQGVPAATRKVIQMYLDRPKDDLLEREMQK
jgi:hypothetical protein